MNGIPPRRRALMAITLVLAGCVTNALPARAQRTDAPVNPFAGSAAAAAEGKKLFDGTCVACHGSGGAGSDRAPALNSGHLSHGDQDFDILQTLKAGVRGTQMPSFAALPEEQLWRLVTYVKSLQPVGGPAIKLGDAARGEALFSGTAQCSSCHEINGRGAPLAADLSAVGVKAANAIAAGVRHELPRRRFGFGIAQRYVDVTLKDHRHLHGLVKNEDSFALVLQDSDGVFHPLERREIDGIQTVLDGTFPADQHLSEVDVSDLTAYLVQQKHRDFTLTAAAPMTGGVPYERLLQAAREPQNWLSYWGGYDAHHFSELDTINRRNVSRLQARWATPMPGASPLEATPLVADGIMYVSGPPGDVYAIDARSGLQLWNFHRQQEVVNPSQINPYNRGVALLGNRLFVGTLDDNLIALDARTGRVLWEKRIADTMDGYTMTSAPLALKDRIIVGVSGGEMGARGFIEAYDIRDGRRLWHFDAVPGPGEAGHESWQGDSWKTGSGATWLTGSYDAELNQLYWSVGNPGPDFNPVGRDGDNLYTCSVLSLDPETGTLRWYYQFSPHDTHDWDSAEDMVLADRIIDGRPRKVLMHADRNGFFYILDRTDGAFIAARAFVNQSWNKGFEPSGRPIIDPASVATAEGHRLYPAVGGTNFQAPSFDHRSGRYYLAFQDAEGFSQLAPATYERGKLFLGIRMDARPPPLVQPVNGIMAFDVNSGKVLWRTPLVRNSLQAGVLTTRGGVTFAASAEGNLLALDADSGRALWHFQTGGPILASPMSYAVGHEQFVAIAAGNILYSFSLPNR